LAAPGAGTLKKGIYFKPDGTLEGHFKWDSSAFPPNALFTTEISLGGEASIEATPDAEIWRFPISTFSKSERGFDETVQGEAVLIRWPASIGAGRVRITRP
jgi:hypothetical protein